MWGTLSHIPVWYLLYSIVNACRKFEPYKIKSGSLKTGHIMLNHQGHLKIRNVLTEPEIKRFALPNYFCTIKITQRLSSWRICVRRVSTPSISWTSAKHFPSPLSSYKSVPSSTGRLSMICTGWSWTRRSWQGRSRLCINWTTQNCWWICWGSCWVSTLTVLCRARSTWRLSPTSSRYWV